jgi:hypothetical protein
MDNTVTGNLFVTLTDENGIVKDQFNTHNLVVSAGKNYLASRAIGTASDIMSHMAIGASTTAPISADTTLGDELGRAVLDTVDVTDNTVSYSCIFLPGVGTGAVTEAGIFNDVTAGSMLCRTTFNVINKAPADTLTISWNVTIN